MSDVLDDRFAAPRAEVADRAAPAAVDRSRLARIASGQRLMVVAVLVSMGSLLLRGPLGGLVTVVAAIVVLVGSQRVAAALGRSAVSRFLLAFGLLLPLLNVLVVVHLSGQATKALREAGIRVGLLGARVEGDAA